MPWWPFFFFFFFAFQFLGEGGPGPLGPPPLDTRLHWRNIRLSFCSSSDGKKGMLELRLVIEVTFNIPHLRGGWCVCSTPHLRGDGFRYFRQPTWNNERYLTGLKSMNIIISCAIDTHLQSTKCMNGYRMTDRQSVTLSVTVSQICK